MTIGAEPDARRLGQPRVQQAEADDCRGDRDRQHRAGELVPRPLREAGQDEEAGKIRVGVNRLREAMADASAATLIAHPRPVAAVARRTGRAGRNSILSASSGGTATTSALASWTASSVRAVTRSRSCSIDRTGWFR